MVALGAERRRRPVPRIHRRLGREALGEHPRRLDERVPVAAREVDAPDRVGEDEVAGEEAAVREERDVVRRVAGDRDDVERDACDVERLAAVELGVDGVVANREPAGGALGRHAVARRRVDRRAGSFREIGEAGDVIRVGVGDEDRAAARAGTRELEPQLRAVAARIDDDGFGRAAFRADDVAVRADRTHLVAVDDERHDA